LIPDFIDLNEFLVFYRIVTRRLMHRFLLWGSTIFLIIIVFTCIFRYIR
jgi:hypothetical protein